MIFIKKHLFLAYGFVVLFIQLLLHILGTQYDSGGLAGLLILTAPIWSVMYWAPNEIIFTLNNGIEIEGQKIISIFMGLSFCLVSDYLLNFTKEKQK